MRVFIGSGPLWKPSCRCSMRIIAVLSVVPLVKQTTNERSLELVALAHRGSLVRERPSLQGFG